MGLNQAFGITTEEKLNTVGLYRFMRHPLYSFGLVFIWLTPTMTRNTLLLFAALTVYIIIGAHFEERKLENLFGEAYRQYKTRTSFMIPFIF